MSDSSHPALTLPALCLVSDCQLAGGDRLLDVVAAAVAGGLTMLQLREKDLSAGELYALGLRVRPMLGRRCALVVNDRLDVALALGADGVQLGAGGLPVAAARRLAGAHLLIGRSVHAVAEAVAAERDGADFLLLGTIYPSRSHPGEPGAGPGLVARVRAAVALPLVAIGGIAAGNVAEVMAAGADGVAVISAIMGARDPSAAAAALAAGAQAAWRPGGERT
ncbi:MAG: thiamine phosphate synthase [Chloroflexota bacterium]